MSTTETPAGRFVPGFIGTDKRGGGVRYYITEGEAEHFAETYVRALVPVGAHVDIAPSTAELFILEGVSVSAETPEGETVTLASFEDMDGHTFTRLYFTLEV